MVTRSSFSDVFVLAGVRDQGCTRERGIGSCTVPIKIEPKLTRQFELVTAQ